MDNAQQPVGKQWRWYTTTSGIWQTVFVEPRHASHIGAVSHHARPRREHGDFHVPCAERAKATNSKSYVHPPAAHARSRPALVVIRDGVAAGHVSVPPLGPVGLIIIRVIPQPTCGCAATGRVLDEVRTYFGMREITRRRRRTAARRRSASTAGRSTCAARCTSRFTRMASTRPATPRRLRDDIAFAKKAGFDFLRIHIKIDDPLLLYYADTLGILLMTDFPNFGEGGDTPLGRARFETMMRAAVERDFNHPSIIAWCMFNETWGFGGQVELIKWMEERQLALRPRPKRQGSTARGGRQRPRRGRRRTAARTFKIHNDERPQVGAADVAGSQGARPDPAHRGHERRLLGAPRILPAHRDRHQFVAFLHQRLRQGARAHRKGRA